MREGRELDRISFRHGIRTVNFRRSEALDENGNGEFTCIVNGEPIFVMGTNHVPADVFHSRDVEHIPHIIGLAEEAGCNLIRCWGGNVYEHESFFDLCDEKGILVWQDFSMACAVYPQDDAFVRKLEREAVAVIRRLRQHACLALWCGDNECDLVPDWAERPLDRSRNRLTREVIPAALRANDPLRSYVPSSPYVSPEVERRGQRFMPENHLWGPRDYYKSAFYQNSLSLFVSEIGYHACPVPVSMQRFLTPGNVWPVGVHSSGMHDESCVAGAASANPEWLLHATTPVPGFDTFDYRIALMFDQVRFLFGSVPQDMEEFSLASQCVQAEANKFFIEWFRGGHHPSRRRTGIVWWNLRDGWPQFSDAVVDYYYEKKLAFDMIRRAQSPVLVMLREPNGWTQDIVICNDLRVGRELSVRIINLDTDRVVWEKYRIYAPGDGVTVAGSLPCTQSEQGCYLIEWDDVDPIVLASPGDSSSVVNSIPANVSGKSHYLNGLPAFSFSRYSEWLCKAGFMSLNTRRCPNVIKHKEASLY
jgi:beta-mannosidase